MMLPAALPLLLQAAGWAAPKIARWIGGDSAGRVVDDVVGLARRVTGADDADAALARLQADPELAIRFQREMNALEIAWLEAETERLTEINRTMRVEASSADPYTRRWRPTWGYVSAAAWGIQALAIAVAVIGATWLSFRGQAGQAVSLLEGIGNLVAAMTVSWSVALAVLGVQIRERSKDKAVAAGATPAPGILGAMLGKLTGGGNG